MVAVFCYLFSLFSESLRRPYAAKRAIPIRKVIKLLFYTAVFSHDFECERNFLLSLHEENRKKQIAK